MKNTALMELLEWVRKTYPMDLNTPREFEEKIESLLEKEVMCPINCKCNYILTSEQGCRIIKCLKCGDVKPI